MNKKLKILLIILGIIFIIGIVFFTIDYNRVQKQEKPIFCLNVTTYKDGGTKEYYGLGYKVIDFHTLEGFDDVKIGTWFMKYKDFEAEMKLYEDKFNKQFNNNDDEFYAKIKKISEYNGVTTVLVEGLETNDINYSGEFEFSIDDDTKLLWKETKVELSDLKEGQNVLITSAGEILERYPARLTRVIKVVVLENEL